MVEVLLTILQSAFLVPRTIVRCFRQRERWPWSNFDKYLHVPLREIRREFGIRVALGATRNDLMALVLRRGLLIAAAGIVCGLTGAYWTTKLTAKFLLGVKPMDSAIVVGISVFVGLIMLLTSLGPARRAARVDPMVALRWE